MHQDLPVIRSLGLFIGIEVVLRSSKGGLGPRGSSTSDKSRGSIRALHRKELFNL